jgi:hypothetical protein
VALAEREVELERQDEAADIVQLERTMEVMRSSREVCVGLREGIGILERELEDKREELLRSKV